MCERGPFLAFSLFLDVQVVFLWLKVLVKVHNAVPRITGLKGSASKLHEHCGSNAQFRKELGQGNTKRDGRHVLDLRIILISQFSLFSFCQKC